MRDTDLYEVIKSAVDTICGDYEDLKSLDSELHKDSKLTAYGFDILSFSEFARELEVRFDGRRLDLEPYCVPQIFNDATIGLVFDRIRQKIGPSPTENPLALYVDDEEQNLFIFRRKFAKDLNLKTFLDPLEALEFIKVTPEVRLVITDEVMPGMRGNELCDEVHKIRPNIRFILITGNPEHDNNLLYRTLRHSRFFEFFQKPVDFDGKREEYLQLMKGLMIGEI